VFPVTIKELPQSWSVFARSWLREQNIPGSVAMVVAGPSPDHPDDDYRLEFLRLVDRSI